MSNIATYKRNIEQIEGLAKHLKLDPNNITLTINSCVYYGKYHLNIRIDSNNYFQLQMEGSPTGCGLIILSNIVHTLEKDITFEYLKQTLNYFFSIQLFNVGSIMCTLGSAYYGDYSRRLEEIVGFKVTQEYKNPNMSMRGQRIYLKLVNQG